MIMLHGEIYSTKNHQQIVPNRAKTGPRFYIFPSGPAKKQMQYLVAQLEEQKATWEKMTAGLEMPFVVKFRFRRATRGRFDYINMAQGPCDAMKKAGLIPDDNMNVIIPQFDHYVLDPTNPGLDIYVVTSQQEALVTKPQASLFE